MFGSFVCLFAFFKFLFLFFCLVLAIHLLCLPGARINGVYHYGPTKNWLLNTQQCTVTLLTNSDKFEPKILGIFCFEKSGWRKCVIFHLVQYLSGGGAPTSVLLACFCSWGTFANISKGGEALPIWVIRYCQVFRGRLSIWLKFLLLHFLEMWLLYKHLGITIYKGAKTIAEVSRHNEMK